ncbi:MAG: FxLYD domain-containing protein [Nitrososphaerota archaeon]
MREVGLRKTPILSFLFLGILLLLLCFRGVFSAALNVSNVNPVIIVRPEIFKFYSQSPLYVRGANLTITTAGGITSVSVTIYNDGSPRGAVVYVYIYDDAGNLIGRGSGEIKNIPREKTRTVNIQLTQQPQYSTAHKIEVSVSEA